MRHLDGCCHGLSFHNDTGIREQATPPVWAKRSYRCYGIQSGKAASCIKPPTIMQCWPRRHLPRRTWLAAIRNRQVWNQGDFALTQKTGIVSRTFC